MTEGTSETDGGSGRASETEAADDWASGSGSDSGNGTEAKPAFDLPSVLSRLDDPEPKTRRRAVEAVRTAVETDPSKCVPTVPKLRALLERPSATYADRVVYCLAEIADESPDDVAPSTDEIVDFASSASGRARSDAFRCLASVAQHRPDAIVDHVDCICESLESALDEWGIYLLSCLSREHPGDVVSAKLVLVDAIETDPDAYGSAASATLGRIVSAEPTTSLAFVESVVTLVDHDDATTRTNAIACLGDVADRNPAAVEDVCPAVARALESDDPNTRANAAITIARVAAGSPGAVDPIVGSLRARLNDEFAPVRRHACLALGYGGVAAARDGIAEIATDDPDPAVRDRASQALVNIPEDGAPEN